MTVSETEARSNVEAALTFIVPQDSKPYFLSTALTGGEAKLFFESEQQQVTIHDMRPLAGDLSIDEQGFELLHHETKVDDLYDDKAIESDYDREIEELLKAHLGADRVVVFDHTRRSDGATGAANSDGLRRPAARVHVDYTVASGPVRAGEIIGADELERVFGNGGRIAQINVWRPITGPVERSPLALADARSIAKEELVATDQRFADRIGEIYQVAHGATQQWYWVPQMERDEVLLIKGWDSVADGRARFTPHGAFELPGHDTAARARESIEVRTYVIFEGK